MLFARYTKDKYISAEDCSRICQKRKLTTFWLAEFKIIVIKTQTSGEKNMKDTETSLATVGLFNIVNTRNCPQCDSMIKESDICKLGLITFVWFECTKTDCYGQQFTIPLASYSLLPPCMQSSVLVCWLGFDQVGLTNLPASAFVAHLQPSYNQKGQYLTIF
jgi:hypothetical protein